MSNPSGHFVKHSDGTIPMYGTEQTWPKAFRVGPLFPSKNTKAAKLAVAAVKDKQKKQGRLLYDDMKHLAEQAANTGKSLKSFVKKAMKKSVK